MYRPDIKTIILTIFSVLITTTAIKGSPQAASARTAWGPDSLAIRFVQPFEIDGDLIVTSPQLKRLSVQVDSIMRVDTITHVSIVGVSSIDGRASFNENLSRSRAQAMEKFLVDNTTVEPYMVSVSFKGEDWNWFRELVEADSAIPARTELLNILRMRISHEEQKARIKKLDGGNTWKYLAKNIFPIMRCAELELSVKHRYILPEPEPEPEPEPVEEVVEEIVIIEEVIPEPVVEEVIIIEPEPEPEPEPVDEEEWRRRFYIKTDLPYWLMSWSNVAFEVDMAPHWSFNLPIYYSAVNYFTRTIKFRTFSFQPGFRYWFKPDNTGPYLEAHYGMGWWNFAFNGEYRYQDHYRKSPTVGGGVAAGYRKVISKNGRWAMEFGGGVGVYRLNYDRFQNKPNGKLVDSHKKTVFFIDNVNVSISYSFPIEKKKGGAK